MNRGLLVAVLGGFGLLLTGCGTPGEMGYATFYVGGGDDRQGGWSPETPIAVESRFAVRATGDRDPSVVDLRSSNSEVIALAYPEGGADDDRVFLAVGTGTAAVEFFDATVEGGGQLLDYVRFTVAEAQSLQLLGGGETERSAADRQVASSFAMLDDVPVSLDIVLLDASGQSMEHFDVVEATTEGNPITASAGGQVLYLEADEAGSATIALAALSQPASAGYEVDVVEEAALEPMTLQRIDDCRSSRATVEARFATDDGVPVVGVPVSWVVDGAEDFTPDEDVVQLRFADFPSLPAEVTATAAGQTATIEVSEAEICGMGCNLAGRRGGAPLDSSPRPLVALLLLVAVRWSRRR